MSQLDIIPFAAEHREDVLALTIDAWTPVFAKTETGVPRFVFDAFYPDGWQVRQTKDVADLLENEPENIRVAFLDGDLAGFIGLRVHLEDQMGEIYILAVSPRFQRRGIGHTLMKYAEDHIRAQGLKMVMVETGGDDGHAPARETYESFGFVRWPVARYFKEL
ncbi:GNAT family N-acetyltransferase [Roseibium sp. MMSF_3544]|uniref:GNAT family N-acetyltransferase n=1 Tax=unclassified Roseibium TaxID=2629323 RepID=UPI00273D9C42|nr:GNAT family N-acetyltransferase [Roseibium sp. MMSF_3544]